MKRLIPFLTLTYFLAACITYTEETEQKYQKNRAFMMEYLTELGYENSPFIDIESMSLDKQRKKMIALKSNDELILLINQKVAGIPRIKSNTPRSRAFFKEIEGLSPNEAYKVLEKYPDIIVSN